MLAAREALADIVVGLRRRARSVTPRASQAPKLWPAVPVSFTVDRVVGQALVAVALGDLAREHGARRCGRCCLIVGLDARPASPARAPAWPASISVRSSTLSIL